MALDEFQCVVLGDEPAGLWLLGRLGELLPKASLAWVSYEETPPAVCVPAELSKPFSLGGYGQQEASSCLSEPWSAQIVTPSRTLPWSAEALKDAFPELPPSFHGTEISMRPRFSTKELSAIRYAIRHRPELLTYASGIWKLIGRTQNLHPESLVMGALQATRLQWWEPARALPPGITRFTVSPRHNPIEEFRVFGKGLSMKLKGQGAFLTRSLVVSTRWHRLIALSQTNQDLLRAMNLDGEMRSDYALCGLKICAEPDAVPVTMGPLTILFDTDEIPDLGKEAWPVTLRSGELTKELMLWATVSRKLSLDDILDHFRTGMGKLNRLLPFLSKHLLSLSVPLSMESCFSDEARATALETVESALIETYDFTSIQTQTRLPNLYALLPSNGCHYPFPIGPLHAARKILEDIVGHKRLHAANCVPETNSL